MRKTVPAASPDAYVAALDGWRRDLAERLFKAPNPTRRPS